MSQPWNSFVRLGLSAAAVAALFASGAAAQVTLTKVTPEVASPGDLVIIDGQNLSGTGFVIFGASVGGFAGFWQIPVAPLSVSSTQVRAIVPEFGNFVPPEAGSSPFGQVSLDTLIPSLPIFYTEGTFGQTTTIPGASTQQTGEKSVIAFDLSGGAPTSGNSNFAAKLENVPAGTTAWLGASAPQIPPFFPVGDGTLLLDPFNAYFLAGPFVTVGGADLSIGVPIPVIAGVVVNMQFIHVENAPVPQLHVSNALQFVL